MVVYFSIPTVLIGQGFNGFRNTHSYKYRSKSRT